MSPLPPPTPPPFFYPTVFPGLSSFRLISLSLSLSHFLFYVSPCLSISLVSSLLSYLSPRFFLLLSGLALLFLPAEKFPSSYYLIPKVQTQCRICHPFPLLPPPLPPASPTPTLIPSVALCCPLFNFYFIFVSLCTFSLYHYFPFSHFACSPHTPPTFPTLLPRPTSSLSLARCSSDFLCNTA